MTHRPLLFAFMSAAFLSIGTGVTVAVECSVCERKLADCRAPEQAKFVACMNDEKSNCSVKCSNDCKSKAEAQRCTIGCIKSCQSASTCRSTFTRVTARCSNDYQACKKDCKVPR